MNLRINRHFLFASPFYQNSIIRQNLYTGKSKRFTSDEISISPMGKKLAISREYTFTNVNRRVDNSIDLQSYIDKAKKHNDEVIENLDAKITNGTDRYISGGEALRGALQEKYTKLVAEAKTHKNPKSYIFEKYKYYKETGILSKSEADIGYRYELRVIETGSIDGHGVNFGDSLFRNAGLSSEVTRRDKEQFERRVVNKQIENIFEKEGISKDKIGKDLSFKVDPYNFKVTVSGVDETIKNKMEKALNNGENGENLYYNIKYASTREGTNSIQRTRDGALKYRAYHNVLSYTGLKLNELKAKGDTFYTKENVDLKELISKAVDNDDVIPKENKLEYKQIQFNYISEIARRGWENMMDMPLKILYGQKGLVDFGQDIIFDGYTQLLGKHWYSTI